MVNGEEGMAIAETSVGALPIETVGEPGDVDVRLDVHDASRLEWSVSIPLPEDGIAPYGIEVELEIPANVFARHLPWDQLQSWTRLDAAADPPHAGQAPSVDALRRGALAYAHRIARGSEGFARHCRLAGAPWATALAAGPLVEGLGQWLAFAAATLHEGRSRLAEAASREAVEITRERRLVDEYLSVRFLELLASAERSLAALRESRNPRVLEALPRLDEVEALIGQMLEHEIGYRDACGWLCPAPSVPVSLESYLERASRLKKHFQELLFLEPERYEVAERLHNYVAAAAALAASTWAFACQILLMKRSSATTTVSSGLLLLAVVAGAVYAVKDRIKEIARQWISGNVHRFYAQRVARWRAPARRLPRRDVVVRARESFDTSVVRRADPLSPDSGATMPATLVRYSHRGRVHASPELAASGVRRVKHIFRYDLSPLFARLDDPVKQVPFLDAATHRVRFSDAPRCYRVAVRLKVTAPGSHHDDRATLVLHKRGLERLEREGGGEPGLETGVLPT